MNATITTSKKCEVQLMRSCIFMADAQLMVASKL